MNINKVASNDASRWLAAEMAYGKGAGTRRKLLLAELSQKAVELDPKYSAAFEAAYAKLDMDKFAKAAIKERQRLDHVNILGKNARALIRGDLRNVSPLVYLAIIGGYYAHATGYDKVVYKNLKSDFNHYSAVVQGKYAGWKARRDQESSYVGQVVDTGNPYKGDGTRFVRKPYGHDG